MSYKEVLKSFKRKLSIEALIKSLFFGLIVGFAANFLFAFFDLLFGLKMLYVGIAIFAGVMLVSTVLAYYLKFRPTDKDIARRVDGLGLEERVITMNELLGDDSYIAGRQREDTVKMINTVSASLLTFAVSAGLIIAVAASATASVGLSVFSVLAEKPAIDVIYDIVADDDAKYVDITYGCYGDGEIVGEDYQCVAIGSDCTTVTAVPADGWVFGMWTDGFKYPTRTDMKVTEKKHYNAVFYEIEDYGEDEDGEPFDGDPNPSRSNKENKRNGDKKGKEGPPSDGQDQFTQDQNGGGNDDNNNSEREKDNNKIIDGETYYGDLMEDAIGDAANNNGDGDDMGDLIGDYLGGLSGGAD